MQLNGVDLVDRYNRPSVNAKVAVRTFFLNDGEYVDPYDVSACTIFSKLSNDSPASIVDGSNGLIKSDQAVTSILMSFGISGGTGDGTDGPHDGQTGAEAGALPRVTLNNIGNTTWFPPYVPHHQASGIHRVGVGDYVAVLDGQLDGNLSGGYNIHYGYQEGTTIQNKVSSVQTYIDVWTVKMSEDSSYQLFINNLKLFDNTYISVAEPLIITTNNRLITKHLHLGSVVDLKITTDFTIQNKNIDQSILNIFKDYSINNARVKIQKVNEDTTNLPARTTITNDPLENHFVPVNQITSDNTMLYRFDTTTLAGLLNTAGVGGPHGTYIVTARYTVLNQTFVTPPFYFEVS